MFARHESYHLLLLCSRQIILSDQASKIVGLMNDLPGTVGYGLAPVAWQPFLVCCGYLLHFDILKNAKK
jgi:hypothetical protein